MGGRTHHCLRPAVSLLVGAVALLSIVGCNPMAAWTNNQSGKAFYRSGRFAEAREEFRRAAADSPHNPDYVHNYATASRRAGDPIAAERAYRQALLLDPSHQPSYHGLAVTLKDTGRLPEARSLLASWVATQPYSEGAYIEMAWLQREMGDHTGAERSLAQALRIKPGHPLALANLGQIYEETGRTQLALAAYQRSLASDWNQPPVASRVARLKSPTMVGAPTAIAIAPAVSAVAAAPGVPLAALPPSQRVASAESDPQNRGGSMASHPFRPTPDLPLASQPFRPNANLPLATNPFRPSPNVPLASNPFQSGQVFLNVPSSTPMMGSPTMFTPSGTPASPGFPQGRVAAPYYRAPR